jgi:hypothetical protein
VELARVPFLKRNSGEAHYGLSNPADRLKSQITLHRIDPPTKHCGGGSSANAKVWGYKLAFVNSELGKSVEIAQ